MINDFNFLFLYMERENIYVEESEFLFQLKSHPDYPSLLSISDTLSFLNIDNKAFFLERTEIQLLPDLFICLISTDNNDSQLVFVNKTKNRFKLTYNEKTEFVLEKEFKTRWKGIVLLIEKNNYDQNVSKQLSYKYLYILPIILSCTYFFYKDLSVGVFFITSSLGIFLSVTILKDLFGIKNDLINKFCNISNNTNCNIVTNSTRWKIFKYFKFSDLSLIFFSTQLICLLINLKIDTITYFFSSQKFLLLMSIPLILITIYYQKYVEKKWCPICLLISSLVLLELFYLLNLKNIDLKIIDNNLLIFTIVFMLNGLIWTSLKSKLSELNQLKEFKLQANRFMRNYEGFKNNLIKNKKIYFPTLPLTFAAKEGKIDLIIVTSPFCRYCKQIHNIVEKIYDKHYNNIKISLIISADIDTENEEKKLFLRSLLNIYFEYGEKKFLQSLHYWYENNNITEWLNIYKSDNLNLIKVDSIYATHKLLCDEMSLNYTPVIFINGYKYPIMYRREDLEFFINEVMEDNL